MKYYERENGSLKVKEYKITKENVVQGVLSYVDTIRTLH